ncbi:aldose 1-epimerase [Paenibacillus xerothermodurans]|uniref:Aldose 1-epimerase n=1 Tax=Paenibacillus xerothermodurans TaxID=1977292 RepID=A0A2W1P284_PAEXE|nr:aldose 1-epimerase [Paenibacillus xerothermodurans]PZE21258.1 aldose 1-epimerase [Paenibacillus xerothermodurans]
MLKQIDWQGTPAYVLENDHLTVSICPAIGNNVYSVWDKKLQRETLRCPGSPATLGKEHVQYGTPILMPPNRIRDGRFEFEGRTYQFDVNQPATGNHIHGLVKDQPWTVTEAGEREDGQLFITSVLELGKDPEVQRQYPHQLTLTVTYVLDGSKLTHSLLATNHGHNSAPFGYGLHTWFQLDGKPDNWQLTLPVDGIWELDDANVPLGHITPLGQYDKLPHGDTLKGHNMDTVFQIGGNPCSAVLASKDVEIRYEGSNLFKQWVVYTKGDVHDFICLEPYTWVTNAPNISAPADVTGFRTIEPGTSLELDVTLELMHK